ncbi:Endoribonuclease YbeY [Frankliniella fusca]|uniref:Endoribonuclease YbeY n=1 Tax=Frankliniella fusca TaxID=407009 RepID=A0AAE1LJA8_9NEOP|nr:Endoribonuclease YbeY [Frankliniella fusca]
MTSEPECIILVMPNRKIIHGNEHIRHQAYNAVNQEFAGLFNADAVVEAPIASPVASPVQSPDASPVPSPVQSPANSTSSGSSDAEFQWIVESDGSDSGSSSSHGEPSSPDSSDNDEGEEENADANLRHALQVWSNHYLVSHAAINSLLAILKPYHPGLPLDARTLKETPKRTELKYLVNGVYCHIGLRKVIVSKSRSGIKPGFNRIDFDVFIDGFPIYRSRGMECTPILFRWIGFVDDKPSVIGLFYGRGKPNPLDDFLIDFMQDVQELRANGIELFGQIYPVDVRYYLADAPGRAYLKCIKGHTSANGCERCDQEGDYEGFQLFSTEVAQLRTDESFAERQDPIHHHRETPLLDLQTRCISQFPLDSMHLVDLGVCKRFLKYVLSKGPPVSRMSAAQIEILGAQLDIVAEHTPVEFTRKPTLYRFANWKSAEFRTVLLYVGPVVFRQVLKDEVYKLFLLLSSAMYIMHSDSLIELYFGEARQFVELFVTYSSMVFGRQFVVYNVHSLLHLWEDVQRHGKLSAFAAYCFEGELAVIKSLLRSSSRPVQQIHRRLTEMEKVNRREGRPKGRGLLAMHHNGPLPEDEIPVIAQYSKYEDNQFTISISQPDNFVGLSDGKFALVQNILLCEGQEKQIVVRLFERSEDLYDYPMPSSNIGVYLVSDLSLDCYVYHLEDIVCLNVLGSQLNHFHLLPYHLFT